MGKMTASIRLIPRLSIGLPVYNADKYLSEALDCLLAQTFTDFELIVCDNASIDGTAQICADYAMRDSRIRWLRHKTNVGAIANFNHVLEVSRAPLFKWAAHDDLHHPLYLENCVRLLDRDPTVVLAHSATAFIGETGDMFRFDAASGTYQDPKTGVWQSPDSPAIGDSNSAVERFWQVLARARWGTHMFGVIRREALAQTRQLPNFAGSDRAMLAELALLGRFRSVPERLFFKRFHADVSWALNQKELKRFLSADGRSYSRRVRQLQAFYSAPSGKAIGTMNKSICVLLVSVHCLKVAAQSVVRKEARNANQGAVWRRQTGLPM